MHHHPVPLTGHGVDAPPRARLLSRAQVGTLEERYELLNKLGAGAFGVVTLATDRKSGERYAVKELKYDFTSMHQKKGSVREGGFPIEPLRELCVLIDLHTRAQHRNLIGVREVVAGTKLSSWYLVMEYCEYDLDQVRRFECADLNALCWVRRFEFALLRAPCCVRQGLCCVRRAASAVPRAPKVVWRGRAALLRGRAWSTTGHPTHLRTHAPRNPPTRPPSGRSSSTRGRRGRSRRRR